ncbi:MAG: ATP-binding protein [Candidatus Peribacteria bacterium]|jgi:predicted AAA+ superfamily ATPase|nr:ATP-binding protein [Candidatus Peribacteria bacterium]
MYTRIIHDDLLKKCFTGKAIILYGPRQVGKTTLVRQIQSVFSTKSSLYLSGDDRENQETLQPSLRILSQIVQPYELIIIDEAQRITDIGLIIKLLVENFPEKQIIATGSSSFDLANKTSEPLTGRSYIYKLYPLSIEETSPHEPLSSQLIQQRLIYGSYPDALLPKNQSTEEYLHYLVENYLYKDILMYDGIQKTHIITKILQALALQIGSEFSYNEIATTVGVDKMTVEKYITILEQAYIISLLHPLHTNQRREIKSNKKAYFRDLGVRNAVLNNFAPLSLRNANEI